MPKLTKAVPKYRKHRASGQAVVTIAGQDHYLVRPPRDQSQPDRIRPSHHRVAGQRSAADRHARGDSISHRC
jgi:hypothetical protein